MQAKLKRISGLQLARDPNEVFQAVHEGDTVIVEPQGQTPVAMVDLVDLEILKAVIGHYLHRPRYDPDVGLTAAEVAELDGQPLVNLVISRYLSQVISLGRAAQALGLPWVELRTRLTRLGIPVWTGPVDAEEIRQDALIAESLAS